MTFIKGAFMVLTVLVINAAVAYVELQNTPGDGIGCASGSCNGTISFIDFLAALVSTTITGIHGANVVFNTFYVLILGFVLVVGVIECFRSNVPTLPGG